MVQHLLQTPLRAGRGCSFPSAQNSSALLEGSKAPWRQAGVGTVGPFEQEEGF